MPDIERPFYGEFIRRSFLVVPALNRQAVEQAWTHNPDAVVLDLTSVPHDQKDQARQSIRESLPLVGRGATDAFVHIASAYVWADAEAAVWPGIDGVVLSFADSPAAVQETDAAVGEMEKRHGVEANTVEIVAVLGTAKAVWNVREIITASQRVTSVAMDESSLLKDLGFLPLLDEDPFEYFVRGKVIMEAAGIDEFLHGHHGVYRVGLGYPLSCFPRVDATMEEVWSLAKVAKENGCNGAFCLYPSWVEPCNRGFTPTDEGIEYHRAVRRTYAEGVAVGRGAVAFVEGRFVERPVDEIAKKIMLLRRLCDERDAQKAAARA